MKSQSRFFTFAIIASITIFTLQIHAVALNGNNHIVPYHDNTNNCYVDISAEDNKAEVEITYFGNSSTFLRADISVKLQKRILLAFWRDVNIGYTDNVWTDSSIFPNDTFSQSFAIDGTGYYRALITVKFYGTTGVVDTVEFTEEFNYN